MTMTIAIGKQVLSQFVSADSIFVRPFILESFDHMQEVLGGDCFAIALPCDIILWCSVPDCHYPYKHTITIQHEGAAEHVFGNVVITSNDDDNINGICSLSDYQLKWLRENFHLAQSDLHGNYVLKFFASKGGL